MTTTRAIRFAQTGGPDVLDWQAVGLPAPAAGEVTLRHTAIGLNYIDTYHRSGLYALPLPSGLGLEAAGVVEAVGHRTLPVFAVQWHPERLCGAFARPESADGARLLHALLR